jgi:hypothetical protein
VRVVLLAFLLACGAGGKYADSDRVAGNNPRGETNGRNFDFVSYLPDGEDWQVNIRDSKLWAAYSEGEDSKEYKPVNINSSETEKLWALIEEVNLFDRKKGKKDEDEGYVMMRLREPGGEEGHDVVSVFVSRATKDEAVLDLGAYLQKLIMKYYKKEADF